MFGNECLLLSVKTSQVAAMNGHRQCTVHASGGSFSLTFFEAFVALASCSPKFFTFFFLVTELFLSDVPQSLVSLRRQYNAHAWHWILFRAVGRRT